MEALNLTKRYPPATQALSDVSFTIRPAAITALLGMNGAGKSTIVNLFSGVEQPTSGSIRLDGVDIELAGPSDAEDARIGVVHQELPLLDSLTAAENMVVGRERRLAQKSLSLPRRRHLLDQYAELAGRFAGAPRGSQLVDGLPLRQRQIVAIIRALWGEARYIFFDEPSTSLDVTNRLALRSTLKELTDSGVGLVYVTHFLDEALAVAQQVVVLRDGRMVLDALTSETDLPSVVAAMTGASSDASASRSTEIRRLPMSAQVEDSIGGGPTTIPALKVDHFEASGVGPASFEARFKEILGVYGTEGCGANDLLEGLAGLTPHYGAVERNGEVVDGGVQKRLGAGIILVTGDRKAMLVREWSVRDNLAMTDIARSSWFKRPRGVNSAATSDMLRRLGIKGTPSDITSSLSGGNQQKLVLGRLAGDRAAVCLAIDPTRGIDVAARAEVQVLLQEIAEAGATILISSTDPQEVAAIATRVLIFQNGKVVAELVGSEITADNLEIRSLQP